MKSRAWIVGIAALWGASVALGEGGDPDVPADIAAQRTLRERNLDDAAHARMGGIRECWNPQTRNFEQVEEGRPQRTLDYRRCRLVVDAPYHDGHRGPSPDPRGSMECWNPRARHFEGVRPGKVQDDLDFSRCRIPR